MDLGAQNQRKNPKSEGLQWDLRILELDLRFRGGLGLSPIGLKNFRRGLSPSPPLKCPNLACCNDHLDDGEFEHPDRYVTAIRIDLRREFCSMR